MRELVHGVAIEAQGAGRHECRFLGFYVERRAATKCAAAAGHGSFL
jgi:hypothetical protein